MRGKGYEPRYDHLCEIRRLGSGAQYRPSIQRTPVRQGMRRLPLIANPSSELPRRSPIYLFDALHFEKVSRFT